MIKVMIAWLMLVFGLQVWGQSKTRHDQTVPWLSAEQAQQKWEQERKPYLIDVYTTWCVYCKAMDKTTWKNKDLVKYVQEKFYPVKFDAESKEDVFWKGTNYQYKTAYKVHMLAAEWLLGNMIYPSVAIVPPDGEPIVIPGFMSARDLESALRYFGEKHYLATDWKTFQASFTPTWK